MSTQDWHGARYRAGQRQGHYESWFLRANHPTRKQSFWIRYTLFSPHHQPEKAIGELWAIHSDGETGRIRAAKSEFPMSVCQFSPQGLNVKIDDATLQPGVLEGEAKAPYSIRWSLRYDQGAAPLLFLPEKIYTAPLPKAKAVTPKPFACFNGTIVVDGETFEINNWIGSENHNWGSKHTDTYAWGQVAGFDNAPDAFFEAATAKLKLGPIWTPPLTMMVLRVGGQEYRLNALTKAFRAKGEWRYFDWRFSAKDGDVEIDGHVYTQHGDFVGLTYYNPPGGTHTCLNSKVAACELTLKVKGQPPRVLKTANRAAFEILTDDTSHGVKVVV